MRCKEGKLESTRWKGKSVFPPKQAAVLNAVLDFLEPLRLWATGWTVC